MFDNIQEDIWIRKNKRPIKYLEITQWAFMVKDLQATCKWALLFGVWNGEFDEH